MARKQRIEWDNSLHHVMARGIDGRSVFSSESEKAGLIKRLAALVPELEISIYAWVIMPNHLHLLLRTAREGNLSRFMHRLLTGFAVVYNKVHDRRGHVFQGRFKSILVQEEEYFSKLIRYIHLNPLKAGIVKTLDGLDDYIWSGHSDIIGTRTDIWMDTSYVLDYFSGKNSSPYENYRSALQDELNHNTSMELLHGSYIIGTDGLKNPKITTHQARWETGYRVLGNKAFALTVVSKLKEEGANVRNRNDIHIEVNRIMERISEKYNVSIGAILGRSQSPELSAARAVIAYTYSVKLGLSQTDIAKKLNMSQTGVSTAIKRGQSYPERNFII